MKKIVEMDNYADLERIAIRIESGMDELEAVKLTKEESDFIKNDNIARIKALQAKQMGKVIPAHHKPIAKPYNPENLIVDNKLKASGQ